MRQPLILGYVLGGVILGPQLGLGLVTDEAGIELISEFGLILLLFIIGLEINLRELARLGKAVFLLGFVQFFVCTALGMAFFRLIGIGADGGRFGLLYLAVALALSSTLIVVKLLHDKFEINTSAGRLTVGVLILQDICAIAFMAFQPNLLHPQFGGILKSLALGLVLVLAVFAVSRHLMARLFHSCAKSPELVLLTSVAWCFLICGLAEEAGLSKEMGALIAGMSIAAFPYGTDVTAKLAGVRDFFVTLFFVSLGLKVLRPTWGVMGFSLLAAAFVTASRLLCVVPTVYWMGRGLRSGLLTALNLSQISEFSLVILALGAGYGHISRSLQAVVLTSMLTTSVLATYIILFNDRLARWGMRFLDWLGLKESGHSAGHRAVAREAGRDIVLLGCFREGEALLEAVENTVPELKERILVVDYNPDLHKRMKHRGFLWVYGDLAHPQTLQHIGIEESSLLICSIPDTFLKGITNLKLLRHLGQLAPKARIVMMAESRPEAEKLLKDGASDAVIPSQLTGAHLLDVLRRNI